MSRSLATTTVIILVASILFVVFMLGLFLWIGHRTGWPNHLKIVAVATVSFISISVTTAILFSYLLSPRSIDLSDARLTINRAIYSIEIPLVDISSVRRIRPEELKGVIKTMGSDGLFARIGHFHSPSLGNFKMYSKDSSCAVLIEADERYVISPSNPDEFVRDILSKIKNSRKYRADSEKAIIQ